MTQRTPPPITPDRRRDRVPDTTESMTQRTPPPITRPPARSRPRHHGIHAPADPPPITPDRRRDRVPDATESMTQRTRPRVTHLLPCWRDGSRPTVEPESPREVPTMDTTPMLDEVVARLEAHEREAACLPWRPAGACGARRPHRRSDPGQRQRSTDDGPGARDAPRSDATAASTAGDSLPAAPPQPRASPWSAAMADRSGHPGGRRHPGRDGPEGTPGSAATASAATACRATPTRPGRAASTGIRRPPARWASPAATSPEGPRSRASQRGRRPVPASASAARARPTA